jgi:hypothetical protein
VSIKYDAGWDGWRGRGGIIEPKQSQSFALCPPAYGHLEDRRISAKSSARGIDAGAFAPGTVTLTGLPSELNLSAEYKTDYDNSNGIFHVATTHLHSSKTLNTRTTFDGEEYLLFHIDLHAPRRIRNLFEKGALPLYPVE